MTKVVGIDVGRKSIICCPLENEPPDLVRHIQSYRPIRLSLSKEGIDKLLTLGDIFILEPTGADYWPWVDALELHEAEYHLVSGLRIRNFARLNGINSKGDREDACVISCYGLINLARNNPMAFLPQKTNEIRQYWNSLKRMPQTATRIKNQIRARLIYEAPELDVLNVKDREWASETAPSLWRKIAGLEVRGHTTITPSIGRGISWITQELALQLCHQEQLQGKIEEQISQIIENDPSPSMQAFRQVFAAWEMSDRIQSSILAAAYPLEQFLDEAGQIIRLKRWNNEGSKQIRINKTLKGFQRAMAHGQVKIQSGSSMRQVRTGDRYIHGAIVIWLNTKCVIQKQPNTATLLKKYGVDPKEWKTWTKEEQDQWKEAHSFKTLFSVESLPPDPWDNPEIVNQIMEYTGGSYRICQLQLFYHAAPQNQSQKRWAKISKTYSKFCRLLCNDLVHAYQDAIG